MFWLCQVMNQENFLDHLEPNSIIAVSLVVCRG